MELPAVYDGLSEPLLNQLKAMGDGTGPNAAMSPLDVQRTFDAQREAGVNVPYTKEQTLAANLSDLWKAYGITPVQSFNAPLDSQVLAAPEDVIKPVDMPSGGSATQAGVLVPAAHVTESEWQHIKSVVGHDLQALIDTIENLFQSKKSK